MKGRTDRGRGDKCWRFRRFRRHSPHIVAEAAGPCAVTIPGAAPLPASFSSCVSLDGNGFRYDGPRTKRFGFFNLTTFNGFTGGVNNTVKGIGRMAYGYRSLHSFRAHILISLNTSA